MPPFGTVSCTCWRKRTNALLILAGREPWLRGPIPCRQHHDRGPDGFHDLRQPRISGAEAVTSPVADPVTDSVPEPATITMLGLGVIGLGSVRMVLDDARRGANTPERWTGSRCYCLCCLPHRSLATTRARRNFLELMLTRPWS